MKAKFIIQSTQILGYYEKESDSFKGIIYATRFDSEKEAEIFIEQNRDKFCFPVTIVKIY